MINALKGSLRRAGLIDRNALNAFLRHVSGVIHVGAHTGQERRIYAQYGLEVLWIEAHADVFEILKGNLAGYPHQRALRCLLTDEDNREYQFGVASNAGGSSSILELALHKDIWPHITFTETLTMTSKTLSGLFAEQEIDHSRYDALVMDTQGSELLVLKGAAPLLSHFKYIQTEVADFEAYRDCCQLSDIESFLAHYGYRECQRKVRAEHPNGGRYFDVVFRREGSGST